jgi:hypothetical protein
MTIDEFITTITDTILADPEVKAVGASFHLGIPPVDDSGKPLLPCITLDGVYCLDDKIGSWRANINLWSDDLSFEFIKLSKRFLAILDSTLIIETNGFIHRPSPERGNNRSIYPIRFYINS